MTVPNAGSAHAVTDARTLYQDLLRKSGYEFQIDEDGDLVFKTDRFTFILVFDGKDSEFFRLILPSFWRIDDQEEQARALAAANDTNSVKKAVKIMVHGSQVSASIEAFYVRPEDAKSVFDRMLNALRGAADHFALGMSLRVVLGGEGPAAGLLRHD